MLTETLMLYPCYVVGRNVTRKLIIKFHSSTQWIRVYNYIHNIKNLRIPPVCSKIVKRGPVCGDKRLGV